MVVFVQSGCIRAKGVVFRQEWLYSNKVVVFVTKVLVFGQSGCFWAKVGCIRAKMVVFVQKWLSSGRTGCIWAKWLVFEPKLVVFGQNSSVLDKKSCCIRVKVVVIGQM